MYLDLNAFVPGIVQFYFAILKAQIDISKGVFSAQIYLIVAEKSSCLAFVASDHIPSKVRPVRCPVM